MAGVSWDPLEWSCEVCGAAPGTPCAVDGGGIHADRWPPLSVIQAAKDAGVREICAYDERLNFSAE